MSESESDKNLKQLPTHIAKTLMCRLCWFVSAHPLEPLPSELPVNAGDGRPILRGCRAASELQVPEQDDHTISGHCPRGRRCAGTLNRTVHGEIKTLCLSFGVKCALASLDSSSPLGVRSRGNHVDHVDTGPSSPELTNDETDVSQPISADNGPTEPDA